MTTLFYNKEGVELTCKICGKNCEHLGSHIYHKHGITAKEYKEEFELPYSMSLISVDVYQKKVDRFEEDREKYLKNLTREHSFKKGQSGNRRISGYERKTVEARIKEVNERRAKMGYQPCPVCAMKFKHLESHLFNAHGFIKVANIK